MNLEELKKLCDEASPGPWEHRFGDDNNHGVFFGDKATQNICLKVAGRGNGGKREEWCNCRIHRSSQGMDA